MSRRTAHVAWNTLIAVLVTAAVGHAHSGPPFPIVSNRVVGSYQLSIWTDPDTTDDGSAAGRFWVTIRPGRPGATIPSETRATVSITPLDGSGPARTAGAEPVHGDVTSQFAALVMDHEGRFHVRVAIAGPSGPAEVDADVDATYDLRPAPWLIALYVMPFVLVGFLWIKLLLRRRRG
jgi:acetylornithine deacetylase/succinyl-diaminopimelate desuccinylase-like protein